MIPGLMHYLVGAGKLKKVHKLFLEYAQSYIDFLDFAQQRAIDLTQGHEWEVAFGLQRSLKKQQVCRFEHLFSYGEKLFLGFTTLDGIIERLDRDWSKVEEDDLLRSSKNYRELKKIIQDYRARANPEALAKHRTLLERDPQYSDARNALADRAKRFGSEMKTLLQK